jgi:DNA-binding transcriptional ArsR family regulator
VSDLDPVIHPAKRLRLAAVLAAHDDVSFAHLRATLGLSDPDLSRQLQVLEDAGYVRSRRSGAHPRRSSGLRRARGGAA